MLLLCRKCATAGRLLDRPPGPAARRGHGREQPAFRRNGRQMIITRQVAIAPIALVGLIAGHEIPVTFEIGGAGHARMREHLQIEERIALRADGFRHLLEIDQIETQARACMQELDHVAPRQGEPFRTHAVGEMPGQQRCIVVAPLPAQPGQPPDQSAGLDRKRQNEEHLTIVVATKHDGGDGAAARVDIPLPGSEAIEGLECRAVGVTLECSPILLDNVEIAMDVEIDARSGGRLGRLGTSDAHRRRGGPGQGESLARRHGFSNWLQKQRGPAAAIGTLAGSNSDAALCHCTRADDGCWRLLPDAWLQPFLNKSWLSSSPSSTDTRWDRTGAGLCADRLQASLSLVAKIGRRAGRPRIRHSDTAEPLVRAPQRGALLLISCRTAVRYP